MFQYINSIVLNSLTDPTTGLDKVTCDGKVLKVLGVGEFKKENIKGKIHYMPYTPQDYESAVKCTFSTSNLDPNTLYKLSFYIKLSGSQNSLYSNAMVLKGKPFVYEFSGVKNTEEMTSLLNKLANSNGDKITFNIGSGGHELTIFSYIENSIITEGKLEYLVLYSEEAFPEWHEGTHFSTLGTSPWWGTYKLVMKDLRLPTMEARRFGAVNGEELPIPGHYYNQFVIEYCTDRGVMGTDAVGDTVTSVTYHSFWVDDIHCESFIDILKNLQLPIYIDIAKVDFWKPSNDN